MPIITHKIENAASDYYWKKVAEIFWKNVTKKSEIECWEWNSEKRPNGYGIIKIYNARFPAHRISYFLHNRNVSEDLLILHKCDNPCCVNPSHLYAGTQANNVNDMKYKTQINGTKGITNKINHKLLIKKLTAEKNGILLAKMGMQITD